MAADCGSTCPVEGGFYLYDPSIAANAVLLAVFALLLPIVILQALRSRTVFFSAALIIGLVFDILGFVGRLLLHSHPDNRAYFFLNLLGSVVGPSFASKAIFLVLPHTLSIHGETLSGVRPVVAGLVLYVLIVAAIIIQLVGVIFTGFGFVVVGRTHGADIVAAGLGLQIVSMLVFFWLHYLFLFNMTSRRLSIDPKFSAVYRAHKFKWFLRALELAAFLLLLYSVYRLVEMASGIDGALFQSQAAFMVVDGAIPAIAFILLVAFHPGAAFGDTWALTSPRRVQRPVVPLSPLQLSPGYIPHHRYDPEIRRQFASDSPKHSPKHYRHYSGSSGQASTMSPGARSMPGLPSHPKSGVLPPLASRRYYDMSSRPGEANKNMVDSDALW